MAQKILCLLLCLGLRLSVSRAASITSFPPTPPHPILPIPLAHQLAWQERELSMFFHFGVNTYTDVEWGDGTEDPRIFNPTAFNASQWVEVAKEAGFKTVIVVAKHHDGFCLWPSQYTNHSVKSSPWRGGKGDVVGDLADAASKAGLRLGVYLSPWDQHEPTYGDTLRYNEYYMGQLRELLTWYGPVVETWFDGAKEASYRDMHYDFATWFALDHQLQPSANIFSGDGPDVRWVGNEQALAGLTSWALFNRSKSDVPGTNTSYLNEGDPDGPDWVPPECDVSLRKGWFWHPDEKPKSLKALVDLYFTSSGRNCLLLLNVPPNRLGLLSEPDVRRVGELRRALDGLFAANLAENASASASSTRGLDGPSTPFSAGNALTPGLETYWAAEEGETRAYLEVDLGKARTFNVAKMQEPIALGQRVRAYSIWAWQGATWQVVSRGTTIGYTKLDRFAAVMTRKVRLQVEQARATPLIAFFGLYHDVQEYSDVP
eukprot:jgi/Mesen1/9769/ME000007S09831